MVSIPTSGGPFLAWGGAARRSAPALPREPRARFPPGTRACAFSSRRDSGQVRAASWPPSSRPREPRTRRISTQLSGPFLGVVLTTFRGLAISFTVFSIGPINRSCSAPTGASQLKRSRTRTYGLSRSLDPPICVPALRQHFGGATGSTGLCNVQMPQHSDGFANEPSTDSPPRYRRFASRSHIAHCPDFHNRFATFDRKLSKGTNSAPEDHGSTHARARAVFSNQCLRSSHCTESCRTRSAFRGNPGASARAFSGTN